MIAGFSGRLVAGHFLEHTITAPDGRGFESSEPCRLALRRWRARCRTLGPASSLREMLETGAAPFVDALGYPPPRAVKTVPDALAATIASPWDSVALVVTSWADELDAFWRTGVTQALSRGSSWCVLFNGQALRLVSAARLYSRRYAEFCLDLAIDDPKTFHALWSIVRPEMLGRPGNLQALVAASDRHAAGVSRSLRAGVLQASGDILAALYGAHLGKRHSTPGVVPRDAFEQALTIVYRMLFLLFAEARGLVPVWHRVYRESYSIEALSAAASRGDGPAGSWDALRAIARLAHAGCRAGDLRVTPFNGRLFAPARTPLAERRDLDDEAAMRAVLAVSTRPSPDRAQRDRIAYRDLGVEQLGAVYETLLDYAPKVRLADHSRPIIVLESGSRVRKETGTFYTPQPLAHCLVRRTLAPLVSSASSEQILGLRVVDPSMGSGAFLVSACRFLAGAYERARIREGGCHPSDFDEAERSKIRRLIAERCLYGVDLNPMAVQLARLSLWLATLAAGRPLTFLDHRLMAGDSLLGAWLSNLRRPPVAGRRRSSRPPGLPMFDDRDLTTVIHDLLPARFRLEAPDDTVEQVREKERAHAALWANGTLLSKWKRVADLWCASWFANAADVLPPRTFAPLSDAILTGAGSLPGRSRDRWLRAADEIAAAHRFFHWELEFPEVFFDRDGTRRLDGGFDAVLGNPPWDMVRADSGPADARPLSRRDAAAAVRFTRDAGIYSSQSDGHANRYQMFLERAIDLTRPGGRIGLVLPAGLAGDRGSAALRRRFLTTCDVDALVGFDNRLGAFPIHRGVRFLLATATAGGPTRSVACRFGESNLAALDAADADEAGWHPISITPALLDRISGDGWAIPWLREPVDLRIAERAACLFPPLGSPGGWGICFGRELNATDDRDILQAYGRGLTVVEGKHIGPFKVDLGSARYSVAAAEAAKRLNGQRFACPRLAYRDVAGAANRLTLIAAVLPAGCVSTHTVFCLRSPVRPFDQHLLCGFFNSFVVNYLVRQRVSTHVTTAIVEHLPIPRADRAPRLCREIAACARLLARRPDAAALARMHALVARLYQLSDDEFAHVLGTFPLVPEEERKQALRVFATETQRL